MRAWARDLEFAYDDGRLYVQDAERTWREAAAVLHMPRADGFFIPVRIEGWSAPPPADLEGWDHVVEFPLPVTSGALALASDGCGEVIVPVVSGEYRARWSGRERDDYRLQLWPGGGEQAELKTWANPADELGDLPALLGDPVLHLRARVAAVSEVGEDLRLLIRLSDRERTIVCGAVAKWAVGGGTFAHAAIHREHPALLEFTDTFGGLTFHGRVAHRSRFLADLRHVHADIAGPYLVFDDVVNGGVDLELGFGQLARGPKTLLEYYALVATAYGIETQLTPLQPGRTGLRVLDLDQSYVVAERFSVE